MKIPHLSAVICAALLIAGCTSTQDVLDPSALLGGNGAASSASQFPPASEQSSSAEMAAQVSSARIRLEPVIGATEAASAPLASRLNSQAATRGLRLVSASDQTTTHILKGYFSAITERGETTVIYVWDVLDPSGTRVHRIQGKGTNRTDGVEGWASVQVPTMEKIADQTLDELARWLASRQS